MKSRAVLKLKPSDSAAQPQKPATPASAEPIGDAPAPQVEDLEGLKEVEVDGRRITFTAKEQIVLRCGKATITLTRAGKIIISGEYVISRSSGVNRIRGGSVQIN